MSEDFFERPILNSPYGYPSRHWELDDSGQPTGMVLENRRDAKFITPIPKPKKQRGSAAHELVFDEGLGISSTAQQYDVTSSVSRVRRKVDEWRNLPDPTHWRVMPETARLLQHWRSGSGIARPFFCQFEAAVADGMTVAVLDDGARPSEDRVSVSTMLQAKGLKFRAVAVMACDDGVISSQQRIGEVGDEADLEEVYNTERQLLYVACTRARDHLLVSAVQPGTEFVTDLEA